MYSIKLNPNYTVPTVLNLLTSDDWEVILDYNAELITNIINLTTNQPINSTNLPKMDKYLENKYQIELKVLKSNISNMELLIDQLTNQIKNTRENTIVDCNQIYNEKISYYSSMNAKLLQEIEELKIYNAKELERNYNMLSHVEKQYNERIKLLEQSNNQVLDLKNSLEPVIKKYTIEISGTNEEKGNSGEIEIYNTIVNNSYYSNAVISNTSNLTARGDLFLKWKNINCLIEVKNKKQITNLDVDKFERDIIESSNDLNYKVNCGIFCSLQTNIIPNMNQEIIKLKYYQGIPSIFIHVTNINNDIHYAIACLEKIVENNSLDSNLTKLLNDQFINYYNNTIKYKDYFEKEVDKKSKELKQLQIHLNNYTNMLVNMNPIKSKITNLTNNPTNLPNLTNLLNNNTNLKSKILEYYNTNNKYPTKVELINEKIITDNALRKLCKLHQVKKISELVNKL
jgi:hypothetical protein